MRRTQVWRGAVAGAVLSALSLATLQTTAVATPAPRAAAPSSTVAAIEARTARAVADSLTDSRWQARLRTAARGSAQLDLAALTARTTGSGSALARTVTRADREIAAAKGLDQQTGSLLRLRLGDPSMRAALDAGAAPLVAVAPADDHATTLTAWDSHGRATTLDATRVPNRPVYLVDLDVSKALSAGLKVLDRQLAARGVPTARPLSAATAATTATATGGFWTTKITSVEVSNDEEPWFKGAAEMFTLVTGFGLDGKVRVDSVDMPYLDYDGTVYYPNQILVNWSNYKYDLADAVMMEDDGDTNYQALASALATALLTITDQGTYIPLVSALLNAMPSSWWTDDPDYVDSWYTLAENSSGRLNGAAANGWMTVEPYFVNEL